MREKNAISAEKINQFLDGKDPQEGIVSIECGYGDEEVFIIYKDDEIKRIKKDDFKPFVWARQSGAKKLFVDGKTGYQNRSILKKKLEEYGIEVKGLNIYNSNGETTERLENGYRLLFSAKKGMSYSKFLRFFKDGGVDVYGEEKDFLAVTPVEQYMIRTGKRFFKGIEDYDNLLRLQFDLETGGLNPEVHRIDQIGIRTNRGYEKIIAIEGDSKAEKDRNELLAINGLFKIISEIKPDVITGHNSENFDWNFIIVRCEILGTTVEEVSKKFFRQGLYKSKKKTVLKLGGEIEYFNKTNLWGYNITDSLHAVRRAQAIDSNMKKADLKYVTKYSKLNKSNRVYIPGDKIVKTWNDTANEYALNDKDGSWYIVTLKTPIKDGYESTTGKNIVERYLKDDLYETDKVELRYNQPNFLLGKLLPTSFSRVCTMGTAGIWKLIMMAWSFENNLGIPAFSESKKFTGGLSRLLKVGFVGDVVKLDYNSLYPSIDITWSVEPEHDISNVMLSLLTYILDQREKYKDLKGVANNKVKKLKKQLETIETGNENYLNFKKEIKNWESEANSMDKRQLPLKIVANSFFGSFGSPNLFPWGDILCAEKTTCVGRQSLRLMVKWFSDRGYEPIVGDSVTYDTPIYIKYDNGNIDIKAISELFDESNSIDFGNDQLRDLSEKPFKILTRNGWKNIDYVYRHKTNKQIHRIETKDRCLDVTCDHSLFNEFGEEIKPKHLIRGSKIEVYDLELNNNLDNISIDKAWLLGLFIGDGSATNSYRNVKYFSKKNNKYTYYRHATRKTWKISNTNLGILEKAKKIVETEYNIQIGIKDHLKSSGVYNLKTENKEISIEFSDKCYTNYRFKKIPCEILNSTDEIKKSFLDGFMAADGYGMTLDETICIGQKSQVTMAGLSLLLKSINKNYRIQSRKDKENFISFNFKNRHLNQINDNYSVKKTNEVWKNTNILNPTEYVYDVSTEDGTFIAGIGCISAHNTDGFNYQMPPIEELNKRYYIGKGLNRNTEIGKEYEGVFADVAEFNDLFMRGKMGLGLDEFAPATINFSRKNYSDLLDNGEIKYVGNTIKSKRMPVYIEKFIEKGVKLLLNAKGKEFLDYYYDYIEKIYNYDIPLRDIASKGRIKKNVLEYKKDCNTLTKAGRPKSRQVWYELALLNNINPDIGETIYYINTGDGKKKSSYKDVEKKTTKGVDGKDNTYEIIINCFMLDNKIVEAEEDTFCTDDLEYNAPKYIEQFNNRIKPLLVCFSPEIRNKILIKTPDKRQSFTESAAKLSSGYPNKIEDQDSYEQLMTMEDKEIKYWVSVNEIPPFIDECGFNWTEIISDYERRMEILKQESISNEVNKFNKIVDDLKQKEVEDFILEVKIPKSISSFLKLDAKTMKFVSKEFNVPIGSVYDIADKEFEEDDDDEDISEDE